MNQTFAGFIRGNKIVRQARCVALYIEDPRKDTRGVIRARFDAALKRGEIDGAYHAALNGYLDICHAAYLKCGRLADDRDPGDWKPLPNGARMRRAHIEPDNSGVVDPHFGTRAYATG